MKTKSNSNMCIKIKKSTQDSWKDLDYGIALSRLDKALRSKLKTKWLHDKWLEGLLYKHEMTTSITAIGQDI